MSSANSSNSDDHLIRRRPATVEPAGWYYDVDGRPVGPFSASEMILKIRAGDIAVDTLVRKDDSQWVAAAEVNGLLEAAHRDSSHFKCPYCGARVDKPPTVCLECDREVTAVYRVREKPLVARAESKADPAPNVPADPASTGSPRDGRVIHTMITWLRSWWR